MAKASGSGKREEREEREEDRAMGRSKANQKPDERVLGDGDFVAEALSVSPQTRERKCRLQEQGVHPARIGSRVAELVGDRE